MCHGHQPAEGDARSRPHESGRRELDSTGEPHGRAVAVPKMPPAVQTTARFTDEATVADTASRLARPDRSGVDQTARADSIAVSGEREPQVDRWRSPFGAVMKCADWGRQERADAAECAGGSVRQAFEWLEDGEPAVG